MSKKNIVLWLLPIFLAAAPWGCDQARSKFDQVNPGMTRQEIEKLLGKPTRTAGDPANPTATWTYGKQQLILQFHQDRVQVKQIGAVEGK